MSRSEALGEVVEGYGQPVSVVRRPGCGAEVAVLEPVGVAFEAENLGVVDEPVDHRGGDDVIAEDLAPAENGLLLVTIIDARS